VNPNPAPTTRALFALFVPAVAQGAIVAGAFTVERLFARPLGSDVVAALALGSVVVWALSTTFAAVALEVGLRVASAPTARTAARATLAGSCAAVAVWLVALVTLVAPVGLWAEALLPATAGAELVDYAVWVAPGLLFVMVEAVLAQASFASLDGRAPVRASIVSASVATLVLVGASLLGGGAAGFGIATTLGATAGCCSYAWGRGAALRRCLSGLRGVSGAPSPWRDVASLLSGAAPILGEKAALAAVYVVFTAWLGWLGAPSLAAHAALVSIGTVGCLLPEALGTAASALSARRRAMGLDVRTLERTALTVAVALALGVAGVTWLARDALLSGFVDERAAVLAAPAFAAFAAMQPCMAVAIVGRALLRAEQRTRAAFLIALLGGVGVRLPLTWLALATGAGLAGVWVAVLADWLAQALGILTLRVLVPGWEAARPRSVGSPDPGRGLTPPSGAAIRGAWQVFTAVGWSPRR
jgi:MATE family multidrug resistance protein